MLCILARINHMVTTCTNVIVLMCDILLYHTCISLFIKHYYMYIMHVHMYIYCTDSTVDWMNIADYNNMSIECARINHWHMVTTCTDICGTLLFYKTLLHHAC